MTIAITGASGQLGRLAAGHLLDRIDAAEVVLLTQTPASLDGFAGRGATVRAADFTDPASLGTAFSGVERLLLISTDAVGGRIAAHRNAVDAAVAAGITRVAYTSVPQPVPENPAQVVPDHATTEEYLRASGLEAVLLRNNFYAELQLDTIRQAAATGRLVTNAGEGRTAYITRADCAAAAVGALLADDLGSAAFDVTGPEALGASDLADLAATVSGGPVEVVQVDDATYVEGLLGAGLPRPVAELITSFGASVRGGFAGEVTGAVRDLTGREPTPLAALL